MGRIPLISLLFCYVKGSSEAAAGCLNGGRRHLRTHFLATQHIGYGEARFTYPAISFSTTHVRRSISLMTLLSMTYDGFGGGQKGLGYSCLAGQVSG